MIKVENEFLCSVGCWLYILNIDGLNIMIYVGVKFKDIILYCFLYDFFKKWLNC